ncbi:DUF4031 domain-containing protein [Leucobacter weissii]|uniref:DUF4031 domain-containing protein n=1 Tax=Leucobacter weissii TaxID=1983706 RepID=A0A939MHA5_9MICO|nr:DUF4031 domain-containing protein [Leucobacter weissii]MBO1900903.1 DUF4031 domain-containing protein [Leucobacter weissii]
MAILIDPPGWPTGGTLWSHLVSDRDYDELHVFAGRLPLPRRSFDLDHYDVPARLYERAVALGARPVGPKDIVHRLRDAGLRVRQKERDAVRPVRRRQYLRAEWTGLGALIGVGGAAHRDRHRRRQADDWQRLGDDLLARWNEPHRRYHDERHLEDVLLALDHLAIRGERLSPATLLAAWFHDAVYAGRGGTGPEGRSATDSAGPQARLAADTDEVESARIATGALSAFDLEPGTIRLVGSLIVETTPARSIADPDPALAHLLDADLAIFASPAPRYDQYARAVRAEYAHVPAADFAAGRAGILRGYLERPMIYRSDAAQRLWEERARANVEREVAELLSSGGDPLR